MKVCDTFIAVYFPGAPRRRLLQSQRNGKVNFMGLIAIFGVLAISLMVSPFEGKGTDEASSIMPTCHECWFLPQKSVV